MTRTRRTRGPLALGARRDAAVVAMQLAFGFVPQIAGSRSFDEHQTVEAILAADYGDT